MHRHGDAFGVELLICKTPITLPQKLCIPDILSHSCHRLRFGPVFDPPLENLGAALKFQSFFGKDLEMDPWPLLRELRYRTCLGSSGFPPESTVAGANVTVIGWRPPRFRISEA